MAVEAFIKADYDTEANRPFLQLLGVRNTPSGSEKLVERIRALSQIESPPIHEPAKWYEALDKATARCGPEDLVKVRDTFAAERLVLSNDDKWAITGKVFRFMDEDSLSGASVIHSSVASLSLWARLGVADRPTAEIVIACLKSLESGAKLDGTTIRRVRACTQVYPDEIWLECGHWPSLDNTWAVVGALEFGVDRRSLSHVADLFPVVRTRVADLRHLSEDDAANPLFSNLRDLGSELEFRLTDTHCAATPAKSWMVTLGRGLQHVKLNDQEHAERVRQQGARLDITEWQTIHLLQVTPYIDGAPAGQPHSPEALWHDDTLYVLGCPMVQIFKALVDELSRNFNVQGISDAIKACADRDPKFVEGYLEHNFELDSADILANTDKETDAKERTRSLKGSDDELRLEDTIGLPATGGDGFDGTLEEVDVKADKQYSEIHETVELKELG